LLVRLSGIVTCEQKGNASKEKAQNGPHTEPSRATKGTAIFITEGGTKYDEGASLYDHQEDGQEESVHVPYCQDLRRTAKGCNVKKEDNGKGSRH
jgi:hypothetical protein